MTTEPKKSFEVEVTFNVDADTPLPKWRLLSFAVAVSDPEERNLVATYFDTADYALGRQGYALRRRTGGGDEGWHIKGPVVDGGRMEHQWPLSIGDGDSVPKVIVDYLRDVAEGSFAPIAIIRNKRIAYALSDATGRTFAEFVDDHVDSVNLADDSNRTWREWEFELVGEYSSEMAMVRLSEVRYLAEAAGATDAGTSSKLARALGVRV